MDEHISTRTESAGLRDSHGRPLRNLRVSVTDRCNLRCSYCMPGTEFTWLDKAHILRFEEISILVDVFLALGVNKVRLTGGEPLLRRDLDQLVALLSAKDGIRDIAMTTNAVELARQVRGLRDAGLGRVTISLDTLRRDRYRALTRRDDLARALDGIMATKDAGFQNTKINTVVVRGLNDDELIDLIEFGREHDLEVRFIEYMDVGGATNWKPECVVPRSEMLERIANHFGEVAPVIETGIGQAAASAPADRFRLPDGTRFGIISSTTEPFCGQCDRSRLTADGKWYLCLYARLGIDLARPLRSGASAEQLAQLLTRGWTERADRGAEERLNTERQPPAAEELLADPHLEMHTRGG